MDAFSPEDMAGFEREAIRPYLKLETFMKREGWSSSKTNHYVRSMESNDKNWCLGLMCLQFRKGVVAFVSELWQCYEGEGRAGLDERWDVGKAVFYQGIDENVVADVLGFVGESEALLSNSPDLDGFFGTNYQKFQEMFKRFISSHEQPFPETQNESAVAVVEAVIAASS
ncbi:MAG: hypothetical protein ACOYB3_01075 [Azonexus sp.]